MKKELDIDLTKVCSITRKVIMDYLNLTDSEFLGKYHCSRRRYYKRLVKYGDPYLYAPLARFGKWLISRQKKDLGIHSPFFFVITRNLQGLL